MYHRSLILHDSPLFDCVSLIHELPEGGDLVSFLAVNSSAKNSAWQVADTLYIFADG